MDVRGDSVFFQASAVAILAAFYGFYMAKIIVQNRQSIKTNQMGIGNKPGKVLLIEKIMSLATVSTVLAEVGSIFLVRRVPVFPIRLAGLLTGMAAVMFFAAATITMRSSWRVGIPEEKTALVTGGIYRWSRNPAFVGFDLLYASMCMLFFNIPLLVVSVWAAVMLHLQILQEEDYMLGAFGEDYAAYRQRTARYLGRKTYSA